jgi:hypothetical protein
MAQKKKDDQFLRKAFDTVYDNIDIVRHIDPDDVKGEAKHILDVITNVNRRAWGMLLIMTAVMILIVVALYATQTYVEYVEWENRPTFTERLTAPYELEAKLPPFLLNAVTVDAEVEQLVTFKTANIQSYKKDVRPPSSQQLSVVVQLQSIVPAQIGDFTLQWNRTQSALLPQCLLHVGAEEQGKCKTSHTSEFIEAANFVDSADNTVNFVMAKFSTEEQAAETMDSVYGYARQIGRIGNFALLDMLKVDYFYSGTREFMSFTWINENWILSVSAKDFDTVDKFMEVFPLYENNPNLSEFAVVQITQQSSIPVVEEPVESDTIDDAVSGTE